SLISVATETLVRSRSSLDRNPLVRPLWLATSAMLWREASRAARSCSPILGRSGGSSPRCSSIAPPIPPARRRREARHPIPCTYGIPEALRKQALTTMKQRATVGVSVGGCVPAIPTRRRNGDRRTYGRPDRTGRGRTAEPNRTALDRLDSRQR